MVNKIKLHKLLSKWQRSHFSQWAFTKSNIYQSREKATIERKSQKMSNLHSPQVDKVSKKHQLLITLAQEPLLLSSNSFSGLLHGIGFSKPSFPFLKNLKEKVKSEFKKNAFEWKKKKTLAFLWTSRWFNETQMKTGNFQIWRPAGGVCVPSRFFW